MISIKLCNKIILWNVCSPVNWLHIFRTPNHHLLVRFFIFISLVIICHFTFRCLDINYHLKGKLAPVLLYVCVWYEYVRTCMYVRKLLCKGPKYRQPFSVNFSNCKTKIKSSLIKFYSDWCNKKGVPVKFFT